MPDSQGAILLLQITDTHLHATPESRMRGVITDETLQRVLQVVQGDPAWPADVILATGDLVQDESPAGYQRFKSLLSPLGVLVGCIPGNHDDPECMATELTGPGFQVGGQIEIGNWCVVLLNTHSPGDDAGRLGAEALSALDQTLTDNADRHVLICMHHQPISMNSAWLDGVGLRDDADFLKVLERHDNVSAVAWGHVHQASDRTIGRVRFVSAPSTCSQFKPNSDKFAMDDRPPGFRWLKLLPDGTVETSVGWAD